jgi:hypothetical protein
MGDEIKVYFSSVSSNKELKGQQQRIFNVLDSKKISYTKVDIAEAEENKMEMRDLCGNPTALPPRFVKGDKYLGDYEKFDEAVEDEKLKEFFGIE